MVGCDGSYQIVVGPHEGHHSGRSEIRKEYYEERQHYRQRDGLFGVLDLFASRGDAVETDEAVEAGGSPCENPFYSVRCETTHPC